MKTSVLLKLSASAAMLALVTVGCKPASTRPASLSSNAPSAQRDAARAVAKAHAAIANRKAAEAVAEAEKAVALAPRDAGYRATLGQAYLLAGRFVSARTAFNDAMRLHADQPQAGFSLALTEVATGDGYAALRTLDSLEGKVTESDRGLGYALAGDVERAIGILEVAARAPDASAKARQNLALGYALGGRWAEARAVAAQDVPADQLDRRMLEWAMFAKPRTSWQQVAGLLGVEPHFDTGQPVALALAHDAAAPVAVAAAEPMPEPQAPAAPELPMQVADVTPPPAPVTEYAAPEPQTEPAELLRAPVQQAVMQRASMQQAPMNDASAGHAVVPALIAAPRAPIKVAYVAPVRKAAAPALASQTAKGGFVVQLGAYSTAARVETAWNRIAARVQMIADYVPSSGTFDLEHKGAVYRLSLAGFETRAAAVDLCERVRVKGGECFVRATFDDRPVRWASRKEKGVQLASR